MFDWLFGKNCMFCDVKIPKKFVPIEYYGSYFCSEVCKKYELEAEELCSELPYNSENWSEFDKRKVRDLMNKSHEQKNVMIKYFQGDFK